MKTTKPVTPPRLADKFFEWYCDNALVEDLQGDMHELFYSNVKRMSIQKANLKYWAHVISLVFSYAIKKRKKNSSYHVFAQTNNLAMLKNYFKVAVRNLARQKFFTFINVTGLAIGMSISLLFLSMLAFIWRYDQFHTNRERIYRVITNATDLQREVTYASSPSPIAAELTGTGIEKIVRINSTLGGEAQYGNKQIPLSGYFVDPDFLNVFTFAVRKGNHTQALQKPFGLAITESAARKLFDYEDPLGKVIEIKGVGEFEITALLEDHPRNSHMHFEILASYTTLEQIQQSQKTEEDNPWTNFRNSYVYLLLPERYDITRINTILDKIAEKKYKKEDPFKASFELQALTGITPGPELFNQIGPDFGYASLLIFGVLTLLILLPACFNYTNISIARALKRSKEIGLRKVIGGQSSQIFFQFIMETVIVTFTALAGAYLLFNVIRDEFLGMLVAESAGGLDLTPDAYTWMWFIGFAVIIGVLTGAMPAFYFSRLNPIQALKSSGAMKALTGISLRKILIVAQFALSLGFIMSVVIALKQYRYTMNYDFGFTQENILDVDLQGTDPQIFRNEFSKLPSVQAVSMSSGVLGTQAVSSTWIASSDTDSVEVFQLYTDENYLSNLQLTLLAGKGFSEDYRQNSRSVIVNEEFLKQFQIAQPQDAVGKSFQLMDNEEVIVTGVVKNFHYTHLRSPIKSFFFRYDADKFEYANLKIATTDVRASIIQMEEIWASINKESKFKSAFFDDEIQDTYVFYFTLIKICGFLGFLAIAISCLGLLGMVVYTTETRIKEVGIRKVMGASAFNLTVLLSKSYIKLIVIAALIAIPVTYLIMESLMTNMQYYRSSIGAAEVLISLGILLTIGLVTIMSQTVSASKANPVDTLRYE